MSDLTPAEVAKAALAEVGHTSTVVNDNQSLNITWATTPDEAFKAWNIGRVSCGLEPVAWVEWMAKITSPGEARTYDLNLAWLQHHGAI